MIRIVIAAGRNPSLTRQEFFAYLQHTHWPLVRDTGDILRYLLHYTQNHVILPREGLDLPLPFPLFETRDSVIELGFESVATLGEMTALPEYRDIIRPTKRVSTTYQGSLPRLARGSSCSITGRSAE